MAWLHAWGRGLGRTVEIDFGKAPESESTRRDQSWWLYLCI